MKKLIQLAKEKQVLCFYLLTFLISWTIWFMAPVLTEDPDIRALMQYIGYYGPALAAIMIAGLLGLNNQPAPGLRYWITFIAFFSIVFLINLLSLDVLGIVRNSATIALMAVIAIPAAMVLSGPVSKNRGIRRLLRYVKKANVHWKWHLVAFFSVPVLAGIGLLIDLLLGGEPSGVYYSQPFCVEIYRGLILYLSVFTLYGSCLGQEPGWRGFALHRLLTQYNPLVSSIIVGSLYSLWTAPLYITGLFEEGLAGFLSQFIINIPLAIPFTWLYMKTKGSLFHVALFSASLNTFGIFIPVTERSFVILILISILCIVAITMENRMWIKRDALTPFKSFID